MRKKSFGDRLREARRAMGMSQAQLAALAGVDQKTVCRWEKTSVEPGGNRLAAAAKALGVDVGWLLTGSRVARNRAVGEV